MSVRRPDSISSTGAFQVAITPLTGSFRSSSASLIFFPYRCFAPASGSSKDQHGVIPLGCGHRGRDAVHVVSIVVRVDKGFGPVCDRFLDEGLWRQCAVGIFAGIVDVVRHRQRPPADQRDLQPHLIHTVGNRSEFRPMPQIRIACAPPSLALSNWAVMSLSPMSNFSVATTSSLLPCFLIWLSRSSRPETP